MRPVVLIILDGWGIAPNGPGNAIGLSNLPFYQRLLRDYQNGLLEASGEAVGLPKGESGNTETGHLNLGAGYIVYQDLPRINLAVADGSFFTRQAFLLAIDHVRKYQSNIHLLGLIGSGGVHSNIEHLLALLQLLKEQAYQRVFLHLITDGRDSPPKSALLYIEQIQTFLDSLGFGEIATVMGRYYAMDRDHRWDRTEKAYKVLTEGIGDKGTSTQEIIKHSYEKGITDEFILPSAVTNDGKLTPRISANDSVIFFNYRIDRPRQLTNAFVLENFKRDANLRDFDPYSVKYFKKHEVIECLLQEPFERGPMIPHLYFVTMTEYSKSVHVSNVAFPPQIVLNPLSECIAKQGLYQLKLAESEKERFVTYYFNGQRENPFTGEDITIVPSPKVPTYDLKPEMSAAQITEKLLENLKKDRYHLIIMNFANPDMVGHTGAITATVKACEYLDGCLSKIVPAILDKGGTVFITGDHGNAEELINPKSKDVDTEHSTYPVPFITINNDFRGKNISLMKGVLADVAPTILDLMKIKKPQSMTGRNLLENILS